MGPPLPPCATILTGPTYLSLEPERPAGPVRPGEERKPSAPAGQGCRPECQAGALGWPGAPDLGPGSCSV